MKSFVRHLGLLCMWIGVMGNGPCNIMELDADMEDDEADEGEDASSDETCSTDGVCHHSLRVQYHLAGDDAYPGGVYSFYVVAPDGSEYRIDCYLVHSNDVLECDTGDLNDLYAYIGENSDVLHLGIMGAPSYCDLGLYHNGHALFEKRVEPMYELIHPNSDGCEPVCYDDELHVAVTFR